MEEEDPDFVSDEVEEVQVCTSSYIPTAAPFHTNLYFDSPLTLYVCYRGIVCIVACFSCYFLFTNEALDYHIVHELLYNIILVRAPGCHPSYRKRSCSSSRSYLEEEGTGGEGGG